MKTSKKSVLTQRKILETKLKPYLELKELAPPRSGWIKAIRGALGITTRQLGNRVGTNHVGILRLEDRETQGAVTLKSLEKVARAMNCKVVYAIVPEGNYETLEAILDERANRLAERIIREVTHTMKLEDQSVTPEATQGHIQELASSLKTQLDPRLWEK